MSGESHYTAEEAAAVGEALGIDWTAFDVDQYRRGMDVELEHGSRDAETNVTEDDPMVTGKIALAHLKEFPDYYDRLEEMEEEAEAYHATTSFPTDAPAATPAKDEHEETQGGTGMSDYLQREDAPISAEVWGKIDAVIKGAAWSQLSVRRILDVVGPFGLELKHLPTRDEAAEESDGVTLWASRAVPVSQLGSGFTLPQRDLAAFEADGVEPNLGAAAAAALAVAAAEDRLLLKGSKALGIPGLLTVDGTQSVKLGDWSVVGAAADGMIAAVTALDAAGFHGPYALLLAPEKYNLLYRRYPQGVGTELDHVRQIVGGDVVKASSLAVGGLLVAMGRQYAAIVVGQDLHAGFVGPTAKLEYEFTASESLALLVLAPGAICVLK